MGGIRDDRVCARLRGDGCPSAPPAQHTFGALNISRAEEGPADPLDVVAARALADVATIGILHERSVRESELLARQLHQALESRVTLEQAKGALSFTGGIPIDAAFQLIRAYARRERLPLSKVAASIVRRELTIG